MDAYTDLVEFRERLPLRGLKGTTGTQATFLHLCGGDGDKVDQLESNLARELGFDRVFDLCGQTYPRIWDHKLASRLTDKIAFTRRPRYPFVAIGVNVSLDQTVGSSEVLQAESNEI